MEKKKPTYDLGSIRAVFAKPATFTATKTAVQSAAALGFARDDMMGAIQQLKHQHFYKSMTAHADHTLWQDVYHLPHEGLVLYIKFTADVMTEFRLLSFKEK